jgi:chemotaxis protein CheX
MRYEYINPIVTSTIRVLDSVIQSDISKGQLSLLRDKNLLEDIVIVVRVKGDSDGTIIVNMETDTALRICSVMNGMEFKSLTTLGLDSISELANMIAGNATSALNDLGFDFSVSPPVVVINEEIKDISPQVELFQIPLYTECGEITINVAMRTN